MSHPRVYLCKARGGYAFVWGGVVIKLTAEEVRELAEEAKELLEET